MNKKQAIIIVTLLVLIVCAGVVAARMNDNTLYSSSTDLGNGKSAISLNDSEKKSTTDFFAETKLERDKENANTLQTLKAIIDDPSSTKESKLQAGQQYNQITEDNFNEGKIESILKSKGYTDAVCIINNNKAKVIVKTKEQITQKQAKEISDVVISVANINPNDIETENRQ